MHLLRVSIDVRKTEGSSERDGENDRSLNSRFSILEEEITIDSKIDDFEHISLEKEYFFAKMTDLYYPDLIKMDCLNFEEN